MRSAHLVPAALLMSFSVGLPMAARGQASDGFQIANDGALFSPRFRAEFEDMNETFGEFGFELEVLEGEQPPLDAITATYGEPRGSDEVEVILGVGDREVRATLRFYYYGDVGFGVLPSDADQRVVRVKRREE